MTLADAVLEYRRQNGLTQRDLAKLLGVTDSVIHRMESGGAFRLTESVRAGLKSILTQEQIDSLEETNTAVIQLKRSGSAIDRVRRLSKIARASKQNLEELKKVGYNIKEPAYHNNGMPTIFDVCIESQRKTWYIDVSGCTILTAKDVKNLCEIIWRSYGAASSLSAINKLSLVFCVDISSFLSEYRSIIYPQELPFDVSILYYNEALSRIDKEVVLYRAPAGKGFYDFESPETKERDQFEYIQWTFLLSQGFINDPTQG